MTRDLSLADIVDLGYLEALADILVRVQKMPASQQRNDVVRLLLEVQAAREARAKERRAAVPT